MENIFLKIKNIIIKKTNIKKVDLFTRIDQMPFDDFDRVMIEFGIEDEFDFNLMDYDDSLSDISTVYDLVKLVEKAKS